MNDFAGKITTIFVEQINIEVPGVDTDLVEEGLLDSLAFVDLLVNLEQEFGITVSPDQLEIDNFRTINLIAEFVGNASGD